jgi:ATP phosphoribosyltransferase regulatory subunit
VVSEVVDASVFNPLPIGARDLLPDAAKRRRAVTAALLGSFARWGYREVVPPLIEYFEVLGRGLGSSERERCVRFIEAGTGELLALRSDVTPQIARMVAQRVGGSVEPGESLRLSYAATLVRLPDGRHDRAELHQVGVEYVGDARSTADAELIGLADEALRSLGSHDHRFDLSHTAVVREAIALLGVAANVERELREALERKDPSGIASTLRHAGVSSEVIAAFVALTELHGPPTLLEDAHERLAPLVGLGPALAHLREVVAAVAREHASAHERLLVDLGEPRGFDYYTGLRVRVWAPGASDPVARGGRYDDLLGRYGAAVPATGLAFDLDALEEALAWANAEVAGSELGPARLVAIAAGIHTSALAAALRVAAVDEARRARTEGLRAWIDEGVDLGQAQRLAQRRGADRITWLHIVGETAIGERWRRLAEGWRLDNPEQEQE